MRARPVINAESSSTTKGAAAKETKMSPVEAISTIARLEITLD
jgi:hypothetical protein